MAETGGLIRCGKTAGAGTHHPYLTTDFSGPPGINGFLAGLGIEGATDFSFPQHQAFDASLIAGNTFADILRPAIPGLDQEIRISQMLASEGHKVCFPAGDHFIC